MLAGTAAAEVFEVPGDFATISDALAASASGDEILVGPGEHAAGFSINKAVTVRSTSGADQTSLVGTGSGPAVILENGGSGGGTLVGFTVTNGAGYNGGGLFLSGDVAVIDCTVSGNSATNGGGAFLVGTPVLSDVRFFDNQAENGGAAFLAPDANPVLDVCDFFGNTAVAGGAIFISPRGSSTTYATIGAGSFDDNAADEGGALYAQMGGFDIVDAAFTGNYAAGQGGAIFTADGEYSSIAGCTISGNEADEGGAVLATGDGELRLQECQISENTSSDWDAAVSVQGGYDVAMQASAVWNNSPAPIVGEWEDLGGNTFAAPQRCAIDYATPYGVIDISDLMRYVDHFTAREAEADLAAPEGMFDLMDLLAFINLYFNGCD